MYLTLIIFSPLVVAQAATSHDSGLSVDANVTDIEYCTNSTLNATEVRLRLQVRFTNVSNGPIILLRKCDRPIEILRSKSLADAQAGRYEERSFISSSPIPSRVVSRQRDRSAARLFHCPATTGNPLSEHDIWIFFLLTHAQGMPNRF